jgi:hypothetical protein
MEREGNPGGERETERGRDTITCFLVATVPVTSSRPKPQTCRTSYSTDGGGGASPVECNCGRLFFSLRS